MSAAAAGPLLFGRANFDHAQAEFKPGDYHLIKRDGEDWPVVICDEEVVRTYFKGKSRPENARQADGTWGRDYLPGGNRAGQKCYPVLIPGVMKFCWPSWKAFEPFDTNIGDIIQETTANPLLAKAWSEALKGAAKNGSNTSASIEYWKGKLTVELAKIRTEESRGGQVPETRKRKGTPKFIYPPEYAREQDVDDDEGTGLYRSSEDITKVKHEFSDSASSAEIDALYQDPDSPYLRLASESTKRSKVDGTGRSVRPLRMMTIAADSRGWNRLGTPVVPANARSGRSQSATQSATEANNTDLDSVIIYVGNPHKRFKAKRSSLTASNLLTNLAVHHPNNGWYIMSPMLSTLEASDFMSVGQYLERGEYWPNLLDKDTKWVRLEEEFVDHERSREVMRCGKVYLTAQSLELPGLQDLAFRKLKALAKNELYQADVILNVIELTFDCGDESLRQYLTHYLAKNFWNIVLAETAKMAEVIQNHEILSRGVFTLLSESCGNGSGWMDIKLKEEQKVKVKCEDETHGDNLPAPSTSTERHTNRQEEGLGLRQTENALAETEEEMIERALQLSSEEYAKKLKEESEQFGT